MGAACTSQDVSKEEIQKSEQINKEITEGVINRVLMNFLSVFYGFFRYDLNLISFTKILFFLTKFCRKS